MHKNDWDDLRFVLAVHDTGTISGAARLLGVNHATVLRRIASFEQAMGGALFERQSHGYKLLADKIEVIEAGRDAQAAFGLISELMAGASEPLQGTLRITSTDTLCAFILPQFAAEARALSASIDVELLCSNTHVDLARLEADVAVRPAMELPEALVGERCAELRFAVYEKDGCVDAWLALKGALKRSAVARIVEEAAAGAPIAGAADSFLVLARMAEAGMGRAVLPCFVGERTSGLRRVDGLIPKVRVPLWVAWHRDMRQPPRMRQAQRRLIEYLANHADEIRGDGRR